MVSEMFKGNSGKISAMRVGFLVTLLVVLLNWSYVNYTTKTINPVPENMVMLVVGLAGAKVTQRFAETIKNEPKRIPTDG